MSKIIFTSGVDPEYDDIPEVRCEFARRYLKIVTEAIGDWVIYYEPRRRDQPVKCSRRAIRIRPLFSSFRCARKAVHAREAKRNTAKN